MVRYRERFGGEEINAYIVGMKEKPILFSGDMVRAILSGKKTQTRRTVKDSIHGMCETLLPDSMILPLCPYGKVGDQLWVRETFGKLYELFVYRSDYPPGGKPPVKGWKWKPSIFMPRAASRIQLEITNIRIERLHDITNEDAMAEGVSGCIEFSALWKSINGPASYYDNPWVWVINFKIYK